MDSSKFYWKIKALNRKTGFLGMGQTIPKKEIIVE